MPKFVDYACTKDVTDIMERILEAYPNEFPGFNVDAIQGLYTRGKEAKKFPVKLHPVRYPNSVLIDEKVYFVEVFEDTWKELSETKKHRCIYRIMCQIPEGAFDAESKTYGKKIRPDDDLFYREYQKNGGKVDWLNDDSKCPPIIPSKV